MLPWLFGIARNVFYEELRARKKHLRSLDDDDEGLDEVPEPDQSPSPEGMLLGAEADAKLAEAMAELSEERRAALVLRIDHGLDYDQIAEVMGWPLSKVKNEIHRARLVHARATVEVRGRSVMCPTEELEALVAEELDEESAARVRAHVAGCASCQAELKWLAAEAELMARRRAGAAGAVARAVARHRRAHCASPRRVAPPVAAPTPIRPHRRWGWGARVAYGGLLGGGGGGRGLRDVAGADPHGAAGPRAAAVGGGAQEGRRPT